MGISALLKKNCKNHVHGFMNCAYCMRTFRRSRMYISLFHGFWYLKVISNHEYCVSFTVTTFLCLTNVKDYRSVQDVPIWFESTEADSSVISGPFTVQLKVKTSWPGPQILTAGGDLIMLTGICMARISVYPATFVILQQCSRHVILGMDFLNQHGAIVNLKSKLIMLSEDPAVPPESSPSRCTLSVLEDQVTILPCVSMIISVNTEGTGDMEGIVKSGQQLLDLVIAVARRIVQLRRGKLLVMVINFSQEFEHWTRAWGLHVIIWEKL